MSSVLKIAPRDLPYFHRDFVNDVSVPKQDVNDQSWSNLAQRVAFASLPFFSLYNPLAFSVAVTMGSVRVFTSISELYERIQQHNAQQISVSVLNTLIAVVALAGTALFHPVGMIVTTGQDLLIGCRQLFIELKAQKYKAALERIASIVNNALYLGLYAVGSIELSIASLAFQAVLGLYHSSDDFRNGRWIEGSAHMLMSIFRVKQTVGQVGLIKVRDECMRTLRTHLTNSSQITEEVKNNAGEDKVYVTPEKMVATATKASKYLETYNVYHQTINGFSFHIADYTIGERVVTCLNGPLRGRQLIGVNGVIVSESYNAVWYSDYFFHRHTGGTVTSWSNRQVVQID